MRRAVRCLAAACAAALALRAGAAPLPVPPAPGSPAPRAASVLLWLVDHGIPQARLTARGFGKTQPVADNGSEAGRARNRRGELRVAGCGK